MLTLNDKKTTSSLAPPIFLLFYVAKNWQLKDRWLPLLQQNNVLEKINAYIY